MKKNSILPVAILLALGGFILYSLYKQKATGGLFGGSTVSGGGSVSNGGTSLIQTNTNRTPGDLWTAFTRDNAGKLDLKALFALIKDAFNGVSSYFSSTAAVRSENKMVSDLFGKGSDYQTISGAEYTARQAIDLGQAQDTLSNFVGVTSAGSNNFGFDSASFSDFSGTAGSTNFVDFGDTSAGTFFDNGGSLLGSQFPA